jgi:hypothetical protein
MHLSPLYTVENVTPAFQLVYTLTVFWRMAPGSDDWIPELSAALETDGIRILEHRFADPVTSLFLISTLPTTVPVSIPARVKGRLQHLLKKVQVRPFQRNYDLATVGSTHGEKLQQYVASQVGHHSHVDNIRCNFADLQIVNPEIDLLLPRFTNHARCTCNVHIVLVHIDRNAVMDVSLWERIRSMIRRWAEHKNCLLGQAGIMPDHVHLTVGCNPNVSPLDLALSLMNNLSWVHGMRPIFVHGCYLGTFGRYDLGAIQCRDM